MTNSHPRLRWVVFTAVLLTYLFMSSQRTASGLITEQLMSDFQLTAITVGLLASMQFFVYTAMQIPMGVLADRYGPHFFLISGAALTGIGTIAYSLTSQESVLFIARMLIGVGDATVWVNLVLILGQWFTAKEFTRLIGVASMMGNLGYLLATVPFSLLIGVFGWRAAFFSAGILLCLCGGSLYMILVQKTKRPVFQKNRKQREKTWVVLRRVISEGQSWALFFCHFGIVGSFVGFISSWGIPYGMHVYEITRPAASLLIMTGLFGAIMGGPLASLLSSWLKTIKKPYIVAHILLLSAWSAFVVYQGHPPFALLTALFFLIGLAYGANALTFAVVRQYFPAKDAGIVTGYANTGGFLSAILLPGIFGKVLDHFQMVSNSISDGYFYGFFIPVIFSIIGLIGMVFLKVK